MLSRIGRMLDVMHNDIPYTRQALMEQLGLKSNEVSEETICIQPLN